jgi:hypothetical protein
MNKNPMFTALRLLVLGALLAGFNVKAAGRPALQGTFTLTSETQWGSVTLPAGDYSFQLDHSFPGGMLTVFRGMDAVGQIMTPGIDENETGPSEIVIEDGAVRKVRLPQIGVTLDYPAPQSSHGETMQEPILTRNDAGAASGAGR